MADNTRWFVIHTYSGYENKVASNILTVVENRKMQDQILEVRIPTEIVTEIKDEKKREVERKIFPGYVMIRLACVYKKRSEFEEEELTMTDEAWYVIRNTRGVTGFVGPGSKPVPLSEEEVIALGIEKRTIEVDYNVGDLVNILSGPFDGFSGVVSSIDLTKEIVVVMISMLGRETPVELQLNQVEVAID
ncbi:MAG: transcription termination/antitermination protein NusG [Clostridia bacterium]|nr:transcription termination/antitermination protein NusG [Clostridia bacterium]MBR2315430.1 transcription termination/antitermination protein NusG [Clostridia bacterium]